MQTPETTNEIENQIVAPPTANVASGLPSKPRVNAGWKIPGVAMAKLEYWTSQLRRVNQLEPARLKLSDPELRKEALSLKYRSRSGEPFGKLIPETYSLIREAARRSLNMRHYDVQIFGGIALANGCITEMQTGEGKTLTATLPLMLHSLVGKGSHLATVNDYLANRDAQWMKPIFEQLGLSVGVVLSDDTQDQRRAAYNRDITYGTAKEFGFDFLRDRLLLRAAGRLVDGFLGSGSDQRWNSKGDTPVQRGLYYCLVDEADSILIDEARTPLIIGSLGDTAREIVIATYRWAAAHATLFELHKHFEIDPDSRRIELNSKGRQMVRGLPRDNLVRLAPLIELYEYTERAIRVERDYHFERQYVVVDGEIVIVDEFTGRLAEGRKWRDGIHQAVEAKEEIEVSVPTGQAARVTIQDLFLQYEYLSGMTGTAASSSRELYRIYKTAVIAVPTNRPPKRKRLSDKVYGSIEQKFDAIVDEVEQIHAAGRPVLIGTRSIDKSQGLAEKLRARGLQVNVLNAHHIEKEAEIVAAAGKKNQITVATNMAGRGTDIKLTDDVRELGGMFVICTELHDAARIDRQLIGRCGRQGDPGSYRQYLALDDEILRSAFGLTRSEKLKGVAGDSIKQFNAYGGLLRRAQRKVERRHFRDRMALLHHEKERTKVQYEMGQDPYLDTAE